MKNKRMISLLLAAAMIIALVPATAFAAAFSNIQVSNVVFYSSGCLQSFDVTYDCGSGSTANTKMGIHSQPFSDDDLTNFGDYSKNHADYATWALAADPKDCGFVSWDTSGAYDRPGSGSQTRTVTFADNTILADATGTYYVYAWTYWNDDQARHSKVYPDAFIFSFTIGEDSTIDIDTPTPTQPPVQSGSNYWVKYNGGNSFSTNKGEVPTSVEIDGAVAAFSGNGSSFTVSCVPANASRITVRWNSTSVSVNFKPDAAAYCAQVELPKTGDAAIIGYALMALVAVAGAMGFKK